MPRGLRFPRLVTTRREAIPVRMLRINADFLAHLHTTYATTITNYEAVTMNRPGYCRG